MSREKAVNAVTIIVSIVTGSRSRQQQSVYTRVCVVATSRPRDLGTMSREAADLCYLCPAPAAAHCPACGLGSCCAEHGDLHRDPATSTCHPFTVRYTDHVGRYGRYLDI